MKKRVLCFGDSNTWGYIPGSGQRLEEAERWTGVCQQCLGGSYVILEDGANGRSTNVDDPDAPCTNGKTALGFSLYAQRPIDLVVLMLGTNDLKTGDAEAAARGTNELLTLLEQADELLGDKQPVFRKGARVLLVAPLPLHPAIREKFPESVVADKAEESERIAELYRKLAQDRGVWFLDAGQYARRSEVDCVHMDAQSHKSLGEAIAEKIRSILT